VAIVLVLWALLPVLYREYRSPATDDGTQLMPGYKGDARRLGTWLSLAFRTARYSGETLVIVTGLALVGCIATAPRLGALIPGLASPWIQVTLDNPNNFSYAEVGKFFVASGASTLGLLALISRFSKAGAGIRPALGVAADVDNYLRELPRERTPRAQMAERYTSLLRYICNWREKSSVPESGYDALLIIAHSQGTVITADLLRYLDHERKRQPSFEPRLSRLSGTANRLPVILLTMGCPLRQLYAQRFPDLYRWVNAGPVSKW
jgi:hypothetical protein